MKEDLDCRPPVQTFNTCKKGPVFESMIRHMLVHERRWKCTSCNIDRTRRQHLELHVHLLDQRELFCPGLLSEVIRRKGSVDVETAPNNRYNINNKTFEDASIYCYGTRTLASSRRWPPVRSVTPGDHAAWSTRQSTTQQSRAAMTPAQRARLGYNTYSDLDIPGTSLKELVSVTTPTATSTSRSDLEEVLGKTSPSGLATLAVVSMCALPSSLPSAHGPFTFGFIYLEQDGNLRKKKKGYG
ncbi:MAG: Acyltransferase-domain-containing protein [Aureobasidium pullulans]|nr:MAG: Acyltransferase-domain-containing protein [Aureobasidium pullulans]